jgi:hypothetical protein
MQHDQRFKLRQKTFQQQFSHIYQRRLTALRGPVAAAAAAKWPGVQICERLVQVCYNTFIPEYILMSTFAASLYA